MKTISNKYPTKSKRIKANEVLEELESLSPEGIQLFHRQHVSNECQVYLDEMIGLPSHYRNLIYYLHNMQESDSLIMYLDTGGGCMSGALAIIDAMENAEGTVQVVVTGDAGSAGSIIALSASNLVIGNRARFFLHSASYNVPHSKQGEVESHVENNKNELLKIFTEAYSGFLTENEIDLMLIGKDYYFDADEVNRRLANREKLLKDVTDDDLFDEEILDANAGLES